MNGSEEFPMTHPVPVTHPVSVTSRAGDTYPSRARSDRRDAQVPERPQFASHYGTNTCRRWLSIFDSSTNRTLLHHDLVYASTKTEDWWKSIAGRNHDKLAIENRIPFPFIHTCLTLGTSYDYLNTPFNSLYEDSFFETGISPMNLPPNDQCGFTIVDITDPNHLCYCFTFPSRAPRISKVDDELRRCRPLTGKEYLEYIYGKEKNFYVDLRQWTLITSNTLRELWPEVKWLDQEGGTLRDQQTGHCGKNATVQSLRDLTFRAVFEEALDNIGMEDALKLPEKFLDFLRRLRHFLYESPESVKRPCGIALRGRAVKEDRAFDFSHFPWLEEGAICRW